MNWKVALKHKVLTTAHWLDQPGVINSVHAGVKTWGIPAAVAGKVLYDVANAPEGKRGDVFARDASILVPSVAATYVGLKTISEAAEALPKLSATQVAHIPALKNNPGLLQTLNKHRETVCLAHGDHGPHGHVHGQGPKQYLSFKQLKSVVSQVYDTSPKGKRLEHLAQLFFRPHHDHNLTKILLVGGGIVLAGMAGGMAYDAVTQNPDAKAQRNKVKEAIFQFVANIALCVTGGHVGEKIADTLKLTPKEGDFSHKARMMRWKRTAWMGAGLATGIVAGGYVANWLGKTVVNPFFDWVDNRKDGYSLIKAYKEQRNGDTRKIEPLDLALHLDDIPTMVAIAGVSALLPLIPMFYLVSAWRAGMGYRSCHETPTNSCAPQKAKPSVPVARFEQATPFATFAQPAQPPLMWNYPSFPQYYG